MTSATSAGTKVVPQSPAIRSRRSLIASTQCVMNAYIRAHLRISGWVSNHSSSLSSGSNAYKTWCDIAKHAGQVTDSQPRNDRSRDAGN